ncbi:flagellar FlbD family protein [Thermoleophilum album]|uniref:Flagellar protein FlbD n=1 Tax=Thermoleophilum album TaxID=29539 RepID=A0A1H6FV15_THEAL|nr:flagellar FlbD family protein [Thermoleophilum album]SEH14646.1 flagellar protein FlbD [Thermoleophilum album]
MIRLHRIGHDHAELYLNCQLVQQVEACPDTTITLVTGSKVVVSETCEQVIERIRAWHASVAAAALAGDVDPAAVARR